MAQPTYVTSSIGILITGASAKQSTDSFPAVHTEMNLRSEFTKLFLNDVGSAI